MTTIGLTPTRLNEPLSNHFQQAAQERYSKFEHNIYSAFPDIKEINTRVYWGIFSWSIPKWRQRYLLKSTAVRINEYTLSPGDIVRDYLDFYHPNRLKCIGKEARIYAQHVSAPLFYRPIISHDATYIDIESTYFSILKLIGWNVNYLPDTWLIPGRAPLDFPLPEHKGARNYLVTAGLPKPMLVWNGKRIVEQHGQNVHINRGLWLAVMDILHAIASIAISYGATYVHTDGYILPTKNASGLLKAIAEWGLHGRVLGQGESYVYGIGNYRVGDKKTKMFDPSRVSNPIDYIRPINRRWLLRTVQHIATNRVAERLYWQSNIG